MKKILLSILFIATSYVVNSQITIADKGNYIEFTGGVNSKQFVKPFNISIAGSELRFKNDFERYSIDFTTITTPSYGNAVLLRDNLMAWLSTAIVTNNYNLELAKGNIPHSGAINKFGENEDIDSGTTPEDIWDGGGIYTPPTANRTHQIKSTSANG